MKQSLTKKQKANCWTAARLVHLSESFDQSYGTDEIARGQKVNSTGWRYQQLLDMSAAKAQLFI
ncbi:MAG: hypothetical protein WA949_15920 [Phormidesmis sp.]